jgi:hypothetical protein
MTTGTEPTLPPMGGLALMAHRLAAARAGFDGMRNGTTCEGAFMGHDARKQDGYYPECCTWHYIKIIDRLARGEKP